jgi:surface carbohydrate biosynthesis protein
MLEKRLDSATKNVVILVDSKTRDLDVASLIAFHLRGLGVECYLEPLEAFRAVVAAYRPSMIVFNHLTASHLAAWSRRLAELGVLTAVLPNEGIIYDPDVLKFAAGRYHSNAHIDYFFCWNEPHAEALKAQNFSVETNIEVVGVPRFDFYFEPWSSTITISSKKNSSRPKVLFCTNFTMAQYQELPRIEADKLFAAWADRVPLYKNYWPAIEAHWRSRKRVPEFIEALIRTRKFDITLRPHPAENHEFYARWLDTLPAADRAEIKFDTNSNISRLIMDCDIEISCETCTTALESWIAGKKTVELIFERNPLWYREIQAKANVECDNPSTLPGLISKILSEPIPRKLIELRRSHLEKWCSSPDGQSCFKITKILEAAIHSHKAPVWSKLDASDYRRALKLRAMQKMGLAYHFDPLLFAKRKIWPMRYAVKNSGYQKSIKPSDVSGARKKLEFIGEIQTSASKYPKSSKRL